ncbi:MULTISPECIES: sensor histidine kinase [Streptosporangium]|uniref:histidine kinase n=1 Tax=Streptosporangium brasiliense TaxID=47480 RepID=A0ABT9R414_9ACTN|nr:ATP-binding protein [Streptosporangium brasiliense]MDP9863971.1 signal transduction histidine kinase [Streptosporangium brasiliense]
MTITVLLISALVLGVGALATSLGVRARVLEETVDTATVAARQTYEAVGKGPPVSTLPINQVGYLQVVSHDGRVLAASPAMKGQPPISHLWPTGGDTRVVDTTCATVPGEGRTCFVTAGLQHRASSYGDVMVYAAEPEPPILAGPILEIALAAFSLAMLALLGWGTWRLVGRTLEPVRRMRTEMAEITGASDLSRRMTVPDKADELTELTQTVNATLNQLERSLENQRRFASDASHELRTPLTGLRAKLELALADPEAEDPSETMRSALADAERLQAIVNDLLMLARLDAGVQDSLEQIDLAQLVTTEVERRPPRHEVLMRLKPDVVVQGSRLQLSRLLTNLLANADRHAAGEVEVYVGSEGGEAVLEVADDGLGIPTDQRERVFQRFTRLDSARGRDAGGTGLGLPIARDIASAHRGKLYAADSTNGRGARLVLRLPLSTNLPI